ncbi:DUF4168 domain-containing protein [Nitrospira sp. MA-1]|nr:DUF4168 domain-containing protein [Nitrospira sp. MA-1]
MKSQQSNLKNFGIVACFAFVCLLMPAAVLPAADGSSQSAPEEMVRKNLEPFAGAYKEVSELSEIYAQRILQSEPGQSDALQEEANQKMTQAVAKHGLSVEEYNLIFHTIQSEPGLQDEFMIALQRGH